MALIKKTILGFDTKIIIALIAILIVSVILRSYYLSTQTLMEPDSYYHARMVKYLLEDGQLPTKDPLAYYQLGGSPINADTLLWPITAIIYKIIYLGANYDVTKLIQLLMVLPILFGAIISILFYFLGKEVFQSKKIGLVMATVFAITPALIYRTMAGYFEDDALGFIPLITGLIFFFRAINTKTLTKKDLMNTILAGIFFLITALTWKMYLLIPITLIPLFCIGALFIATTNPNKKNAFLEIKNFGIKTLLALGILFTGGILFGINIFAYLISRFKIILGIDVGLIIIIILLIIGLIICLLLAKWIINSKPTTKQRILFILTLFLCIGILIELSIFAFVPSLKTNSSIESYVTEEELGMPLFMSKLGFLLVCVIITIVFAPLAVYSKNNNLINTLYCFIITAITLYFGWYILKFSYVMGFGLVFAVGFSINSALTLIGTQRNKKQMTLATKITSIIFIFALLITMAWAFEYTKYTPPYLSNSPEWGEAITWLKENTSPQSKLFNWWDQGHLLTFLAEKRVSSDNTNWPCPACAPNKSMGEFLTTPDSNKAYKIAAIDINADYLILHHQMFSNMQKYADYAIGKIDPNKARQFPQGNEFIYCTPNTTNVLCNQYILTITEYNSLNKIWTKENPKNTNFFMYQNDTRLLILTNETNNTNLAKIWLHSPETSKLYEEIYSKNGIKIFRINKVTYLN